jgi:hypothetical protein
MCRLSWNLGASTSWNTQGLQCECFTFTFLDGSLIGAGGSFPGGKGAGREAEHFLLAPSFRMRVSVSLLALYGVYRGRFTHICIQKSLPLPGIQPNLPIHNPTTCLNSMGNVGNNVQCSRFYVVIYTECPTRYRTRHFFNNTKTNEDIATKQMHNTDTFLFISHTTNVLLFKFRCNIFIGVKIIKEMPGSVASGTLCILLLVWCLLVSEVNLLSWPCTEKYNNGYYSTVSLIFNKSLIRYIIRRIGCGTRTVTVFCLYRTWNFDISVCCLGLIKPRIQWVPGFFFLGVKRPDREVNHHLHLVPWIRMSGVILVYGAVPVRHRCTFMSRTRKTWCPKCYAHVIYAWRIAFLSEMVRIGSFPRT